MQSSPFQVMMLISNDSCYRRSMPQAGGDFKFDRLGCKKTAKGGKKGEQEDHEEISSNSADDDENENLANGSKEDPVIQ